ncbi:Vacuolar protein sorting-associated protein 11 [Saitoella coloradoensis]
MALASWRHFNFFDSAQVKDPSDTTKSPAIFRDPSANIICSGGGHVFVGDRNGRIHILNDKFQVIRAFTAHQDGGVTHLLHNGRDLLLSIGDDNVAGPHLKLWQLDKIDKKTGVPRIATTYVLRRGEPFPISSVGSVASFGQIAVGFADGTVVLLRGDVARGGTWKHKVVFESEEPITGLGFAEGTKQTIIYVVTTNRIMTYISAGGKSHGQPARILDPAGCGLECSAVDPHTGDLVAVREDAIYFFGPNGRGPCYAYEGPKTMAKLYRGYVALVSPPTAPQPSETIRNISGLPSSDLFDTARMTIVDTEHKYIAYTGEFPQGVRSMFTEWGAYFLVTLDGQVHRLKEKDLPSKLDILYKKNLFTLAINLAKTEAEGSVNVNEIYHKYGDYLYSKGDFDGAMRQYIDSIDEAQPSQVIRKFLDAQRIHNLTHYLEELHKRGHANADHTTLLLNCYAKLKDVPNLEKFIMAEVDLKFDLETAILVCRQGGYHAQAAYLAEKHGENATYLSIQLEDLHDHRAALEFIRRLHPDDVNVQLEAYGSVLLNEFPEETTQLYIDYYTGTYIPRHKEVTTTAASPAPTPSSFMPNLSNLSNLPNYTHFLSSMTTGLGTGSSSPAPSTRVQIASDKSIEVKRVEYTPAQPRTAFATFLDYPQQFIQFLEALVPSLSDDGTALSDVSTALFEAYLRRAGETSGNEKSEWERKAKAMLEDPHSLVDQTNAFFISQFTSYRDGMVYLREKASLTMDIFQSCASSRDTPGVIAALHKYGAQEPEMYPMALRYLTSDPRILTDASDELPSILDKISRDGLMAPLQVVHALSNNAVATVGVVKTYLGNAIERERREIENNRKLVDSYRVESDKKKKEVDDLRQAARVFQVTRCSACGGTLDLPTVHFLCKHSFHQRCVGESEAIEECPQCSANNATIRAIRKAQEDMAGRSDLFLASVNDSSDSFRTISDWFSKAPGVLNTAKVE